MSLQICLSCAGLECTKKSVISSKSAAAGLKTDTTVSHGALLTINDVDKAQAAIGAEETAAADKLRKRLSARLDKALAIEDKNKEEWMKDTSIVNPNEEVIKLRTKCLEEFKKFKARLDTCAKEHVQAAQSECDVQLAILDVKGRRKFDDLEEIFRGSLCT